jgi:hypothetical protein
MGLCGSNTLEAGYTSARCCAAGQVRRPAIGRRFRDNHVSAELRVVGQQLFDLALGAVAHAGLDLAQLPTVETDHDSTPQVVDLGDVAEGTVGAADPAPAVIRGSDLSRLVVHGGGELAQGTVWVAVQRARAVESGEPGDAERGDDHRHGDGNTDDDSPDERPRNLVAGERLAVVCWLMWRPGWGRDGAGHGVEVSRISAGTERRKLRSSIAAPPRSVRNLRDLVGASHARWWVRHDLQAAVAQWRTLSTELAE